MIFDKETGMQQVEELLRLYTGLQLKSENTDQIVISGNILVNRTSKGYTLYKLYPIEIIVPMLSLELPYIIDSGHSIDESYPHRYTDGRLCLETDTSVRIRFVEGFSLSTWVSEYVEIYFFSYEYFQRYGVYPFGERGHDIEGILQTYEEQFTEPDRIKTLKLMRAIVTIPYRGHMLCPCGSEKKFRNCHGLAVMKYFTDNRLKRIVCDDYNKIMEVLIKHDEQQRNSRQTK